MKVLFADPTALTVEQKEACRLALRDLADGQVKLMLSRALREAHRACGLHPDDFWRNLFVRTHNIPPNPNGQPTRFEPLLTENRSAGVVINPSPQDPYGEPDLQCFLKFLYFGASRSLDGCNPLPDTDCVLRFFGCSTGQNSYGALSGAYGQTLSRMIGLRNKFFHGGVNAAEKATLDDLLNTRRVMLELLEPFSNTAWAYQEEAKLLCRKIDKTFYQVMLPISFNLTEIYSKAFIPSDKQPEAQKLLELVGIRPDNGVVELNCHPVEFVKQLKLIFQLDHLSLEARAAMLRSILPENLSKLMGTFAPEDEENSMADYSTEALEELSDNGNAEAQYWLGWRHADNRDYDQAQHYFRLSANQGDADAQYELGYHLKYGWGHWDPKEAIHWFRRSADQGDSLAMYELGDSYERGYGVVKDLKKAFDYYCRGAERNGEDAYLAMGRCLIYGIGTERDVNDGLFYYEKGLSKNLPKAKRLMGLHLAEDDPERSLELLREAAGMGDAEAYFRLYEQMKKDPGADPEELEELLKQAAFKGYPEARFLWGKANDRLGMIRGAAKDGHRESCEYVGRCYAGAKKEPYLTEAIQYLNVAMELGADANLHLTIAHAYVTKIRNFQSADEKERNRDIDNAVKWLKQEMLREEYPNAQDFLARFFSDKNTPYYDPYEATACYEFRKEYFDAQKMWFRIAREDPSKTDEAARMILELFERAEANGESRVGTTARMLNGLGKKRESVPFFVRAAKRFDFDAQYMLYHMLRDPEYVDRPDEWEASCYLNKAANAGYGPAAHLYGRILEKRYRDGVCVHTGIGKRSGYNKDDLEIVSVYYEKAAKDERYADRQKAQEDYDRVNQEMGPPVPLVLNLPKK